MASISSGVSLFLVPVTGRTTGNGVKQRRVRSTNIMKSAPSDLWRSEYFDVFDPRSRTCFAPDMSLVFRPFRCLFESVT